MLLDTKRTALKVCFVFVYMYTSMLYIDGNTSKGSATLMIYKAMEIVLYMLVYTGAA